MSLLLLDPRTLFVCLALVYVLLSIVMAFLWATRKTYPGFDLWVMGYLAYMAGFILMALRGLIPNSLSIVWANVLILAGAALLLGGVRRFRGVSGRAILSVSLLAALTLLQYYFTFVTDDLRVRIILFSLAAAFFSGLTAWELLLHATPEARFSFLFTGGIFAVHTLSMLCRSALTALGPAYQDFLAPNEVQTATFLSAMLLGIGSTFGFVMLNSERLETDLKNAQVELQLLAKTDFLTGIANSRSFLEAGKRELNRRRRYHRPLALLMLDLDFFKHVNDTHGHAVGDQVLVAVVRTCQKLLRDIDVFGRLGGEEFAMLLPETDLAGGVATAERLRAAVEEAPIPTDVGLLRISISIGVSEVAGDDERLETALKRADDAMYRAKRAGRNRVMMDPQGDER